MDTPGSATGRKRPGRLRRAVSRFTTTRDELDAQDLISDARESGATPVADCGDRDRVEVSGFLRTVTLRPRAGVPALEAELFDGSGSVTLVWLGRRQITGIEPGRTLAVEGLVTLDATGRRLIFNPKYTLRPGAE
ncbi:MAG: OB-fold nucleic acid binding domain-containing protein [Actinomycetes bacterium]